MHLRRGHIMLIAGGAVAVASFAVSLYLLSGNTYSIQPDDRLVIQRFVSNASQGVYSVSFPLFEGQPSLQIVDATNRTIVEETISPPIANGIFTIAASGNHTLILANPASDATLEASVLFGDQESFATSEQLAFNSLLYAGIIAVIAGAVITILDRRRIGKMKQFGDTSDLV
ncbi:MAG TPA: hypothetical protein VFS46_01310 [Nitrososphaera sp.]|nr:hypothetical protein [Nitrososphaera sp.]